MLNDRERSCRAALAVALLVLLYASLAACAPRREAADGAADDALPPTLAATGLFADPASRTIAADVVAFSPRDPLWSDGAVKRRWLRLPPGTAIDASDPERLVFPAGTRFWKEFAFERPVETRYLELRADGRWRYATYLWDARGEQAPLAPECGVRGAYELAGGARFDVPSRTDCLACHEGGAGPVLGFSVVQLAGGPELAALAARGLVRGLPERYLAQPPRLAAASERERAALGWLHANCAPCHNSRGPLASLRLDLEARPDDHPDAAPRALATALGVPARAPLGDAQLRLAAGSPEASVLWRRLATRHAALQMPPLGTRLVDAQARDLIAAWIRDDLAAAPAVLAPSSPAGRSPASPVDPAKETSR